MERSGSSTLSSTSRDCEQVEVNTLTRYYQLERDEEKGLLATAVSDAQAADANTTIVKSNSGNKIAAIKLKTKDSKEKDVIDVLIDNKWEKSIDLEVQDVHGKVIRKPPFASFSWSPNESHLLYVAEKKEQKSVSYFQGQEAGDG